MKSDNKNQREREREKERINSPERIRRRISVLLKSRPFVEPKKSSSLGKRHFNYFLEEWREKMSHTK
jgi:hypothetical protein